MILVACNSVLSQVLHDDLQNDLQPKYRFLKLNSNHKFILSISLCHNISNNIEYQIYLVSKLYSDGNDTEVVLLGYLDELFQIAFLFHLN